MNNNWKVLLPGVAAHCAYELGALDTHLTVDEYRKIRYINPTAGAIGDDSEFGAR